MKRRALIVFIVLLFLLSFLAGCYEKIPLANGGYLEIFNSPFAKEGTYTLMTGVFEDLGTSNSIPWEENTCPDHCPLVMVQTARASIREVYSFSVSVKNNWDMVSQGVLIETGMLVMNILPGKDLPPIIPQEKPMLDDNSCRMIIKEKWRTGVWVYFGGRGLTISPGKELLKIIAIPFEEGASWNHPKCEPSWFAIEKTQVKVVEILFMISGVESKYPISRAGIGLENRGSWGYLFHEPGDFFPNGVVDEESTGGLYVQNIDVRYVPPPSTPQAAPSQFQKISPPFSLAKMLDNKTIFLNKEKSLFYINHEGKNYTVRSDSLLNPPDNNGKFPSTWGKIKKFD